MKTIVFVFAGRQPNIELALPYYRRILEDNPGVEMHVWDLCRDRADSKYLRSLPTSDRFQIRTEFYQGDGKASRGQNRVWKHYATPHYRDCVFVKLDDDDVFIETGGFNDFVNSIDDTSVLSALTINNGASTRHIPALWEHFQQMDIPLLDVHLSVEYAQHCHRWFSNNWETLTEGTPRIIPTEDWVSINAIGYSWNTGKRIAQLIGTRHHPEVAGRHFRPTNRFGDEGAANTLPRQIHTGMVVGHLNFGPQQRDATPTQLDEWRHIYANINYL